MAYLKAFLLRIKEGLLYAKQARDFLLKHPLLIIEFGFHLTLDPHADYSFDVDRRISIAIPRFPAILMESYAVLLAFVCILPIALLIPTAIALNSTAARYISLFPFKMPVVIISSSSPRKDAPNISIVSQEGCKESLLIATARSITLFTPSAPVANASIVKPKNATQSVQQTLCCQPQYLDLSHYKRARSRKSENDQ
jgi:hypothetical protein